MFKMFKKEKIYSKFFNFSKKSNRIGRKDLEMGVKSEYRTQREKKISQGDLKFTNALKFDAYSQSISLEDNIEFYIKNKNKIFSENLFDNYIIDLCNKLEILSIPSISKIKEKYQNVFDEILSYLKKNGTQKITSNLNLIAFSYLIYIIDIKKIYFYKDYSELLSKITFNLRKYTEKNFSTLSFNEKINYISLVDNTGFNNLINLFKDDYHEIETIGYFELNRVIKRIIYNTRDPISKDYILSFLLRPYLKMALGVNFLNKINSLLYVSKFKKEILFFWFEKEYEDLLASIIEELENKNLAEIEDNCINEINWLNTIFQAFSNIDIKLEINFIVFEKLYDYFFDRVLNYKMDLFDPEFIFSCLKIVHNISLMKNEFMPSEAHCQILYKFLKVNLKKIHTNSISNYMLAIFLFMKKSGVIDEELITLSSQLFLPKLHEFKIVDNSDAFRKLIKKYNKDLYMQISERVIDEIYHSIINDQNTNLLNWIDKLKVVCFYLVDRNSKTDAILDLFIKKLDNDEINVKIFSKFLMKYLSSLQNILPVEYKVIILRKILQKIENLYLNIFENYKTITQIYIFLNEIKLPEKNYEEFQTKILKIISEFHKLNIDMNNFMINLRKIPQIGDQITNSTLIGLMFTLKNFSKIDTNNSNIISFNCFIILYSILKKNSEINLELLQTFLKFLDDLFLKDLIYDKMIDEIRINIYKEMHELFFKNNLRSQILNKLYKNAYIYYKIDKNFLI